MQNNHLDRRKFIKNTSLAMAAAAAFPALSSFNVKPNTLGISVWSYHLRNRRNVEGTAAHPIFSGAYDMAKHCYDLGTGGAQVLANGWDSDYAKKMRKLQEDTGMWIEGQLRLPKTENEVDQFEKDVQMAKEGGVDIIRTACLSGRRYMTFTNLEDWNQFKKDSMKSMRLAEPVARKHKVKLAIENHKDWTADEMVAVLKHFDSEWLGCNLDTGNNISFLEDPYEVVEKLAPYTFTTHFKDMGIEEYEDGFLLSEVPFGEGFLDLNRMTMELRRHNPNVKINLEMMTRDPLPIPFLTDQYWITFGDRLGKDLAKNLRLIKENYSEKKLSRVSDQSFAEQLALEEENQIACLNYARKELGIV
ncbi:sugar phosphate isomerase/epimerase [Jiulongibacter sediminis]|uniref:sugar phosphate isomerase/epimerase family protein n=1 Tax=Jiulongibacter sediminis TaxID=1605367 RepID=UPI0026F04E5C|nr:TIM barrel protein [Jiulongibacter sediminis]